MYFSQDEETCGSLVDYACGPVSLANAFRILKLPVMTPESIISRFDLKGFSLRKKKGMSPIELGELASALLPSHHWSVFTNESCTLEDLRPGDLIWVSSIELINAQSGIQFELSDTDSHIVVVEKIDTSTGTIIVINPDCRKKGKGFSYNKWGRMLIPEASIGSVWQSVRADGSSTDKAAVLLRRLH